MSTLLRLGIIILFFNHIAHAQSNKDIKTYGIKTVTETTIDYKDGIEEERYKSKYFAYDKDANIIEEAEWDSDGVLEYRETFRFENGKQVELIEDYPLEQEKKKEKAFYKRTVEEFEKGLKVREIVYDKEGVIQKYELFSYDNMGNRLEKREYNREDVLLETTTYKYNDKGLLVEETRLKNGVLDKKELYEYTF